MPVHDIGDEITGFSVVTADLEDGLPCKESISVNRVTKQDIIFAVPKPISQLVFKLRIGLSIKLSHIIATAFNTTRPFVLIIMYLAHEHGPLIVKIGQKSKI